MKSILRKNPVQTERSKKSVNVPRQRSVLRTRLEIRKILATTDLSDESLAGVRYAAALAERLNAAVTLLHVVEPAPRMAGMEAVTIGREESDAKEWARVESKELAERTCASDLNIAPVVRNGSPLREITRAAGDLGADLIVIATHGYTGARRALLGSTAERVVRHAPCSVLTVPTDALPRRSAKTPVLRLKKILVPMDFSNVSKGALPLATILAEHFDSEIVLLHVIEKFPIDYLLGRDLMNERVTPFMKLAEAELEGIAGKLNKSRTFKISTVVRDGKPFREICNVAKIAGAQLIVLTTHGYTGLKHAWLGSTAERVVRHAPCPVLTVRKPSLRQW